ncbi:hypothetical protein Adt_46977 [Abeliophyllum distichum]|uniref:Uncharacterized protein n=1 Tax=Abeliophyllum distichum TaxID=126358 RepID=A0ABD1NYM5_9LAMI
MSTNFGEWDRSKCLRNDEVRGSPVVSSSMASDMPLREVDGASVWWATIEAQSIMVEADMDLLRTSYMVQNDIELIVSGPHERAWFPQIGYTALHLHAFGKGMRLLLSVFQMVYLPKKLPKKKDKEKERPLTKRRYKALLDKHVYLVELGQMASKVDFEQGKRLRRCALARLSGVKLRPLQLGSSYDSKKKKVIEEINRETARKAGAEGLVEGEATGVRLHW